MRTLFLLLLLVATPWPWTASSEALESASEGPEVGGGGEIIYRIYCASCHGPEGHGDGPVAAELRVRPPDLTRLAKRNGGEFPAEEVAAAIDGRTDVRGHGTRAMPVWGLTFQESSKVADQEAEVTARLDQLVAYLRSLQR